MSRTDWLAPSGYEQLQSLDAPGFAWEFLRRNPEFLKDCSTLERAENDGKLAAADEEHFARRWGVRFRDRTREARRQRRALDEPGTSNRCCTGRCSQRHC